MGRVMISIPQKFLKEVDRVAGSEGRSRSELFREAVRVYLIQRPLRQRRIPMLDLRARRAVKLQDELAAKDRTQWDSTAAIRAMRESRRV